MDTAAAAAAAVVVDLSTEGSKSSGAKLLVKPKPKKKSNFTAAVVSALPLPLPAAASCTELGSTVESMSATPPATPARSNCNSNCSNDIADGTGSGSSAELQLHAMNGLKESSVITENGQPECISATSSTNASTTPTSALLTAPAPAPPAPPSGTVTATPTAASAAGSTTAATTSESAASAAADQLLRWQDMPKYLQFNPYVLRGYRPLQTFKGCLLSLFYWHNETINILTHAIPIFYILAIVPGLMPWDSGYKFLSFCHVFGSVAPWCGSFVYHLFMNIEKGENVYYTLLKLDMVGIWVSQSFGALPLVTATTLCFTPVLKWFIIISYCVLSLWGLYKALTASSPWQRRLCFALPFAMRSVLTVMRIRGMVGGSHMALSHVYLQVRIVLILSPLLLQDGVSILGGAIGAMRIPEKWFPGLVDFYLNSHNIMHVLVVVAVYSMHKATIKDFEWMSTQTCNSLANTTEQALGHMEL
ncbi:hypothetical protein KR222_002057 [Zaprionus bogoriensis]|nr:hypothetical protein KR222_002057 [Zaprionus bogoriensis]